MPLPRVRRPYLVAIVTALTLLVGALPAAAVPAPGFCTADPARGAPPESFPLEACLGTDALKLRNSVSVPVEIATEGTRGWVVRQVDQNPATTLARLIIANDHVLLPGDLATVELLPAVGTVRIVSTKGGDVYMVTQTLGAFFPVGGMAKGVLDALTGLVSDLADAALTTRSCRADRNWVVQSACDMAYNTTVVLLIGKALVKGALTGSLGVIVGALEWATLTADQVPSVRQVLEGERTITIRALLPAPSPTATAPGQGPNAESWGGHSYQLFPGGTAGTFAAAEGVCRAAGGHLAHIQSAEENAFLFDFMGRRGERSAYFGYTDETIEDTWVWIDGTTSDYVNWASGEPNDENPREDYAMFYWKYSDGHWNDGDFDTGGTNAGGNAFLCEAAE